MSCTKHVQRKRKGCPDCFPDSVEVFPGSDLTVDSLKKLGFKSAKELPEEQVDNSWVEESEPTGKFDERQYIHDLIDRSVKEAAAKIRAELADLRAIQWEHLTIPLGSFSMALMQALGQEGWVYKDTYRGEILKVSGCREECVIMTRVKSPKWPAIPDFSKRGTVSKYVGKEV